MADIDMWAEDWNNSNNDFGSQQQQQESGKDFGDDFTVETVSTGYSFSGHSRNTQGSGSTISTHGSALSASRTKTCVIEDLSRPKRRQPRRTRSTKSNDSSSSRSKGSSSSNNNNSLNGSQDIHWDPNEKPEKPRSSRRTAQGLENNGNPSSKRNLAEEVPKKPFSIKDLKEDEQSRASSSSKDKSHKSSRSSSSSGKSDKHQQQPRSRRSLLAENGKPGSLRRVTSSSSSREPKGRERSLHQLFQDNGSSKGAEVGESSEDIFEIVSRADTKESSGMSVSGVGSGMRKSQSMMSSRGSRSRLCGLPLGSSSHTANATFQNATFQNATFGGRSSSGRPSLGRSSSFKMSVKKMNLAPVQQQGDEDDPKNAATKPMSMPRSLGRCASLEVPGRPKPSRRPAGDGSSKSKLPPVTSATRPRSKKSAPSRSRSEPSGAKAPNLKAAAAASEEN